MEVRNGYFKFEVRERQMYLKLYPSENGGAPLDIKEVIAYLEDTGYEGFNLKELNQQIIDVEKPRDDPNNGQTDYHTEYPLGAWKGYYENEKMLISISSDKMLVVCRFYPPSNHGDKMTRDAIYKDFQANRIKVGISDENIKKFLKHREYCKNYILAKGIPPVQGTDARIEYFFNTDLNLKPKRNEDGSVNYRELNTISHVEAGQCLAKLHVENRGKPGKNVFGEKTEPRKVKTLRLSYANKISISEDNTELFSDVTGHASLVNNKVFVSDLYEVPADVDNTTGNIVYDGNVHIKGNVKSGFAVEAKGDIIVEGLVEGAFLKAGGQIIVKRGIHGMAKGKLEAKGNVITKFIENASVTTGGYLETGVILHSQVSAKTDVRVRGKKGSITGGMVRAGNRVEAINIGSEMGAATRIEVGIEPEVKERYMYLQKEIIKGNKELEQIKPILQTFQKKMGQQETLTPDKMRQIQILAKTFKEKGVQMDEFQNEVDELSKHMSASINAKIIIRGTIYMGVWVSISEMGININEPRSHCQIVKEGGVTIRPL